MTDKTKKGKTLFHLELVNEQDVNKKHLYYTNLKSLCNENKDLTGSWWTVVRIKDYPIITRNYIIRKDNLKM